MKRIAILLLAVSILFLAAPSALAQQTMTILLYMCGTDLQDACIEDLYEMCAVPLPQEINLVVQAGGASQWDNRQLKANQLNRFSISNQAFEELHTVGQESMGSAAVLKDFLTYGVEKYPADRYGLVLWNHGGGSTGGICYDETDNFDYLTLGEVSDALEAAGVHFDFIGCDACLMATYENAVHLSPYADYLVASQELEPATGWAYDRWLKALAQNPQMDTLTLCKAIADGFYEDSIQSVPDDYITQSVIYLPQVETLRQYMEAFSQSLTQAVADGHSADMVRKRRQLYAFGEFEDDSSDMVDMAQMVSLYQTYDQANGRKVLEALQAAVPYSRASSQYESLCGLSILVPQATRQEFFTYVKDYNPRGLMDSYTAFLNEYMAMNLGGDYQFSSSYTSQLMDSASMHDESFYNSYETYGHEDSWGFNSDWFDGFWAEDDWFDEDDWYAEDDWYTEDDWFDEGDWYAEDDWYTEDDWYGEGDWYAEDDWYTEDDWYDEGDWYAEDDWYGEDDWYDQHPGQGEPAAPTAAPQAEQPQQAETTTAYGYSLQLSQEDLANLSYVEGMLLMDIGDGEGYVDLGYLQNAWVDWDNAAVYSLFDGSWPLLEDQLVPIYDQTKTEAVRRSLIPVRVNGLDCYLVVIFDKTTPEGRIAGYSEGYDENGLPARGLTPLTVGDEIIPVYTLLYFDEYDEVQEAEFDGDPIMYDGSLSFGYESLEGADTTFLHCFCLNDIFGDFELSDLIEFTF